MDIQQLSAYKSRRLSFSELEKLLQGIPQPISVPEYLQLDQKLNDANTDILSDGDSFFTIGKNGDEFQMWRLKEELIS